jgi:AcrR family transcriptional regulator
VVIQARATATRQRIIDAAVELFTDYGYAETGLKDLVAKADTTTGAFYYHFTSKEDVARAIMDQGWPKAVVVLQNCLHGPNPGLEGVILMSFSLSALLKSDKSVWLSNHLNQAFGQLSEQGRQVFKDHAQDFIALVAGAIRPGDILPDVTPLDVGNMVWITIHGCHLLSDAVMDDVIDRLKRSWHMLLGSIVPAESLSYFEQFVIRAAQEHGQQRAG